MFVAVFIPDFPVEAVVRHLDAVAREGAVAVFDGTPPLVHVIAVNDKARAHGAEAGMTKVQAESVPGLLLKPRSAAQEASAHAALLDCAHGFSPRVESTAPDTVLVDIAGLEPLFGPPAKIARELARRAAEMELEARVGVASNPDAALNAARGFPGITVIPQGKEAARLGELPVDVLAPSVEILETLDRWGVRTFRGLAALPPLAISERLGQEGLRLQALARGETQRPLAPVAETFDFSETLELEEPVDLLEPLAFLLGRLLEQVCARLNARALATNELRLTLGLEVHNDVELSSARDGVTQSAVHQRTLRLPVPMQDSKVFLKLLQLDLNSHPPAAPVKKVMLVAEPVRPRATQNGLFVPAAPEPERLELTLARIRKALDDLTGERVGTPQLVNTHRPDAFRMAHFAPRPPQAVAITPPKPEPVSALRMFRPALPAKVELRRGVPAVIFFNGQRGQVIAAAGPWRSSGDWWGPSTWSRDEWDVAVAITQKQETNVGLYRVYAAEGEWWVEGAYD